MSVEITMCPTCDGRAWISPQGDVHKLKPCPTCEGTGRVAANVERMEYSPSSSSAVLGELTLTAEEIRHLALFCGIVITEPTPKEKEDERETEIVIAPWPSKGVKGDEGMLPPHKHIAYYAEYPEEGCIPLGSPNVSS